MSTVILIGLFTLTTFIVGIAGLLIIDTVNYQRTKLKHKRDNYKGRLPQFFK